MRVVGFAILGGIRDPHRANEALVELQNQSKILAIAHTQK